MKTKSEMQSADETANNFSSVEVSFSTQEEFLGRSAYNLNTTAIIL